jgi:hypothetical protein
MKIGDILYFAPEIRFGEVDLDGPGLPGLFGRRVAGFYITPAEDCANRGYAFAAGLLLVSCIDALARIRFRDGVAKRFGKFAVDELKSFSAPGVADRFYDEFRNGLVHECRLKNGAQFALDTGTTVEQLAGILIINPKYLAEEVRSALDSYVALLTRDEPEHRRLAASLTRDLAEDFRAARA